MDVYILCHQVIILGSCISENILDSVPLVDCNTLPSINMEEVGRGDSQNIADQTMDFFLNVIQILMNPYLKKIIKNPAIG